MNYVSYLNTSIINILSNTPVYIFIPITMILYRVYYILYHKLLSFNNKYNTLSKERQYYIIFNMSKSSMLAFLSYLIYVGYNKNIVHLTNIDWSNQRMFKNITGLYAITDLVPLFVNRDKMMTSTIIHHICVVGAFMGVLNSNLEDIGISNAIILYGLYSSFAFLVNFFLGVRFLLDKDSIRMKYIKKITFINYITSCGCNWSLQGIYLVYYINKLVLLYWNNTIHITNYVYLLLYVAFLYFWISDDIILMRFLLK